MSGFLIYPAVSWVRLPQLPAPAPFLGRDLSRPERETEGQVSRVSLQVEAEVNNEGKKVVPLRSLAKAAG